MEVPGEQEQGLRFTGRECRIPAKSEIFIIMLFHSLINFIRYHISNFKLKIGDISLSSCNCFMIAVFGNFLSY